MIARIIKKITIGARTIGIYKSWPLMFVASLGYFREGPHICKLRNGLRFHIESISDIHILKEVFTYNQYGKFLKELSPGAMVIDIGAHIGIFSVLAASYIPESTVLCFEPLPKNFEMLKKNIALNRMESRVHAFKLAVSGSNEPREFHFFTERVGSSLFFIPGQIVTQTISVQCTTLDKVLAAHGNRCDFLKIDCEGAEHEILGAVSELSFQGIKTITLETHDQITGNSRVLIDFLKTKGYRVAFAGPPSNLLFAKREE